MLMEGAPVLAGVLAPLQEGQALALALLTVLLTGLVAGFIALATSLFARRG
ncbi:hypothetical protein HRbin23_00572 [bacterium HR23]|nr:hypothetical protein HRbin23_00572 [bacterium HR23]